MASSTRGWQGDGKRKSETPVEIPALENTIVGQSWESRATSASHRLQLAPPRLAGVGTGNRNACIRKEDLLRVRPSSASAGRAAGMRPNWSRVSKRTMNCSYGIRIGNPCCLMRTTSRTPRYASWLRTCSVGQSVGRSVGWSVGWSVGRSVCNNRAVWLAVQEIHKTEPAMAVVVGGGRWGRKVETQRGIL